MNRLSSSSLDNKIPYEILNRKLPDYTQIKTVGCLCYTNKNIKSHKLLSRATRRIFIGYP